MIVSSRITMGSRAASFDRYESIPRIQHKLLDVATLGASSLSPPLKCKRSITHRSNRDPPPPPPPPDADDRGRREMGWVVSKRAKRTLARLLCLAAGLLACYHLYVRNDDDDRHRSRSNLGLNGAAPGYGILGSDSDSVGKADDTMTDGSSRVKVRSSSPPTSPWQGRRVAIVEFAPYHEGELGGRESRATSEDVS